MKRDLSCYVNGSAYDTPSDFRVGPLGRLDSWFYLRTLCLVASASRLAARGRFDMRQWELDSRRSLGIAEDCGARVHIEGRDSLMAWNEPVVYVSNHMSLLETFVLPGLLLPARSMSVVLKQSLMTYPAFGAIVRSIGAVAVSRKNPREDLRDVLEKGSAAIRQGRSMLLFPQHTRSDTFDPSAFNTLGVKLARKAGVRVLPVAVLTDFMGVGRVWRDVGRLDRRRPVRFRFGPPLPVEGNGRDAHERTIEFISGALKEWGAVVKPRGAPGAEGE